jgi:hypothetical protein
MPHRRFEEDDEEEEKEEKLSAVFSHQELTPMEE